VGKENSKFDKELLKSGGQIDISYKMGGFDAGGKVAAILDDI